MECNLVKDLIRPYTKNLCSEESVKLVEEHMESCPDCKALCEKNKESNAREAATLHKALLFVSIAIVLCGAFSETFTAMVRGLPKFFLTAPAVGFLLSLINWFFIKRYKSKKSFANSSLLITIGVTVCAYIGSAVLCGIVASDELFLGWIFSDAGVIADLLLTAAFILLSKPLANKYAELRGKK